MQPNFKNVSTGVAFALLWSSASAAGKFGLRSVEPLVLFNIRFLSAGIILLVYSFFILRERLPAREEWKPLTIFGLFNTTLYLGIFILALQYITAGITALAIALNPILISMMSSFVLKRKVLAWEWLSILMGIAGVALATYPLVNSSQVSLTGVGLLFLCMVIYSYGSVYYSSVSWTLSRISINAWQVFIGGLILIPFTFFLFEGKNNFDLTFWLSESWLVLPVSIFSVQLWLRLLKADAVKASLWLFLCPVFGLIFSTILLDEPFTLQMVLGAILVMLALHLGQRRGRV